MLFDIAPPNVIFQGRFSREERALLLANKQWSIELSQRDLSNDGAIGVMSVFVFEKIEFDQLISRGAISKRLTVIPLCLFHNGRLVTC